MKISKKNVCIFKTFYKKMCAALQKSIKNVLSAAQKDLYRMYVALQKIYKECVECSSKKSIKNVCSSKTFYKNVCSSYQFSEEWV